MGRNHISVFFARQRGAALLLFMLLGVIAATSLLLHRLSSRTTASGNQATMQTLALAKEALIGWSASHSTTPGMLPCPEDTAFIGSSSEGQAQIGCSNVLPSVGRLPWRTLKLPQLRDDAGETLWYALSPGFRAAPINGNSLGQLTVDGAPNSAVAIVFSPGAPLPSQSRPLPTSALPPNVAQYLDGINNTGMGSFSTTGATGLFNDRLLTITRENLFSAANRRILSTLRGDAATGLGNYYTSNGNNYPLLGANLQTELTPLLASATNTTMINNGWYPLISYNVNVSRQLATLSMAAPALVSCTITPGQPLCQ
jgi:hypothetical protein